MFDDYLFPQEPSLNNFNRQTTPDPTETNYYDLKIIMNSLKDRKAPGPDQLGNKTWKIIFKHNSDFLLSLVRNLASNIRINEFPEQLDDADFEVYTDGSRVGDSVGCAVCTFKNNVLSPSFCFKLESFNTVFQAEFFAIYFAACWTLENGHKINIYTDSLSPIQILRSPNTKSDFFIKIKEKLSKAGGLVGLSWVKAHPGNETADHFAKLATEIGEF
ncbi:hypothetical protein AVEN_242790-1 [Araneus ventricosus]|uniref:RNase H type-1 domain-containing protein n=1 Tax=Araneus ventricosus TaxID=182803 RepID=A0A4Y2FXM7_ARAVE|nr:hypothetical protein AVEN_242790-1 [Araneus ventricosus]